MGGGGTKHDGFIYKRGAGMFHSVGTYRLEKLSDVAREGEGNSTGSTVVVYRLVKPKYWVPILDPLKQLQLE